MKKKKIDKHEELRYTLANKLRLFIINKILVGTMTPFIYVDKQKEQ
jgi:hypothetical protein